MIATKPLPAVPETGPLPAAEQDSETRDGERWQIAGLFRMLRGYQRPIGIATTLTLFGTILGIAQPLLVKNVVDAAQAGGIPTSTVTLLLVLFAGQALIDTFGNYLLERTGQQILLGIRIRLIGHLLRLRIGVYDRRRMGDLLSRANTDTTLVREAVAYSFTVIVTSSIGVLGAVAMMIWLDPLLFLIVLVAIALASAMVLGVLVRIRVASERSQASVGRMTADLERALTAIRTVRASRAEQREAARIGGHAREAYHAGVRMAKLDSIVAPAVELAVHGSILVILLIGGVLVAKGSTSLGGLVAFLLYATYLIMPLSELFEAAGTIQRGMGGLRRVNVVFALPCEPDCEPDTAVQQRSSLNSDGLNSNGLKDDNGLLNDNGLKDAGQEDGGPRQLRVGRASGTAAAVERLNGKRLNGTPVVEFRGVWFGYGQEPVLRDVSFTVPRHGHIALVGRSGAGKSTVLQLIERFYEPDRGEILFNGRDVRTIDRSAARAWVNLVEQQTPVLQGTLRDNIMYAAPDATEEDLDWVVRTASLTDLIARMPDKLDTEVGDHGVLLSGGERQRVAIARALLARPAVLLMDEPTSQMDSVNERALTRAMREITTTSSLLVIAHRISTVQAADRIVVLDEGEVVATGRHEELMLTSSLYQRLASNRLEAGMATRR